MSGNNTYKQKQKNGKKYNDAHNVQSILKYLFLKHKIDNVMNTSNVFKYVKVIVKIAF